MEMKNPDGGFALLGYRIHSSMEMLMSNDESTENVEWLSGQWTLTDSVEFHTVQLCRHRNKLSAISFVTSHIRHHCMYGELNLFEVSSWNWKILPSTVYYAVWVKTPLIWREKEEKEDVLSASKKSRAHIILFALSKNPENQKKESKALSVRSK